MLGLQEVNDKLDDIVRLTRDRWGAVEDRIGDNDILYRADRWDYIESETYDLNGDGHRHATRAHLKHMPTGKTVTVLNIHLPSSGVGATVQARARRRLADVVDSIDGPLVLLGDLNTESEAPSGARGLLRAVGVEFIRQLVDVQNGNQPSHWNFGKNKPGDGWIDDIGVRDATVTAARLKTMHDVSDHNALLGRITF